MEEEAFGLTWDGETFERELVRENGVLAVMKQDERVVGAALLAWAVGDVSLNSMVLDPEVRGRGWSRTFLGALMHYCQKLGHQWFTLEVKWNNPPALKLYRGLGFVTTACRKKYYRDGQDARIMWAGHLGSPQYQRVLSPFSDLSKGLTN